MIPQKIRYIYISVFYCIISCIFHATKITIIIDINNCSLSSSKINIIISLKNNFTSNTIQRHIFTINISCFLNDFIFHIILTYNCRQIAINLSFVNFAIFFSFFKHKQFLFCSIINKNST